MSSRRNFLKSSAGLAATLAAGSIARTQAPPAESLPKVRFGKYEISRLLVGQNQFYGYSHFNGLLSQLMVDWNTPERICQTLLQCQQNGINGFNMSRNDTNDGRVLSDMELFYAQGGKTHVILTDTSTTPVGEVARRTRAIAMYHHGEHTDKSFRDGRMDQVQEYTKKLRQAGVMVGIGTHKPEVVEYAEERGWDIDFYMLCAYNRTRTPEEIRKLLGVLPLPPNELYLETDPPRAYQVARQTPKTCFLFKILAAGRVAGSPEAIDKAFKDAYDNIKPQDGVFVGMFPRFKDEVKENCDRVRRILNVNS
jgi:hypothetical protein